MKGRRGHPKRVPAEDREWGIGRESRYAPSPVIINVCPAAVTSASPTRVWDLLTTPERYGDWNDAKYVGAYPPGPLAKGQVIHLTARSLGRRWPLDMVVADIDPIRRWIEVRVQLPFGIENRERLRLSETDRGTLVRLNRDFQLPPGWRGRLLEVLLGRQLRRQPELSLQGLIRAAEQ